MVLMVVVALLDCSGGGGHDGWRTWLRSKQHGQPLPLLCFQLCVREESENGSCSGLNY